MTGPPSRSRSRSVPRDRALSAVVGKAMEAAIVVLYISLLIAVLYGGAIPEYEESAGAELGERVLGESLLKVRSAVPEDPSATATVRHDLPRTLDGEPYRVVAANDSLRLVHDAEEVGGRLPLELPADVTRVEGEWHSTQTARIRVERTPSGRIVRLEAGTG